MQDVGDENLLSYIDQKKQPNWLSHEQGNYLISQRISVYVTFQKAKRKKECNKNKISTIIVTVDVDQLGTTIEQVKEVQINLVSCNPY